MIDCIDSETISSLHQPVSENLYHCVVDSFVAVIQVRLFWRKLMKVTLASSSVISPCRSVEDGNLIKEFAYQKIVLNEAQCLITQLFGKIRFPASSNSSQSLQT